MDKRLETIYENFDKMKRGLDDTFKFGCTMCGRCCKNREDILLSAKDVFAISKELEILPGEFIKNYCDTYLGPSSNMPLVRLMPVGEQKICPLLRGHRCSVHNAKPTVCATFPVGRAIKLEKEDWLEDDQELTADQIQYLVQETECGDKTKGYTVREWLAKFRIPIEDEFFLLWQTGCARIGATIKKFKETWDEEMFNALCNAIFVGVYLAYDQEQEFMPQFKRNMAGIKKLLKDIQDKKIDIIEDIKGAKK